MKKILSIVIVLCIQVFVIAQNNKLVWLPDGSAFTMIHKGGIIKTNPETKKEVTLVSAEQLTINGQKMALDNYFFNNDYSKVLLYANSAKVWRFKTKGDYYVYNLKTNKLTQLGKQRPSQTMMFAKFNNDASKVAYVSNRNIYVEDVATGKEVQLTKDGTNKLINGTFDWVYEEEFDCRDGFRWSTDGKSIAYWQIDANKIRDYYMLNTTDSNYSKIIPVEYPKVGEAPSPARIGVVSVNGGATTWMKIPGNPQQHYITRMDWFDANQIFIQQLDRKQQTSKLMYCNAKTGIANTIFTETDNAWVDLNRTLYQINSTDFDWINNNNDFLWVSEKDGWRHIYKISKDGKTQTLLTKGDYDIEKILCKDVKNNYVYFSASPKNPTQSYLYRVALNGNVSNEPELVTPLGLNGVHNYLIAATGNYAIHKFSNHNTPQVEEWVSLPNHKPLDENKAIAKMAKPIAAINIEYVKINVAPNVVLDAWINKPANFDASKKYPVVMYVYGEPAASTVMDEFQNHQNYLYNGDISADGYIQISIDSRGTPMLKGAPWRKAIYRNIGGINISDLASGMKKMLSTNSYMDASRVAVWGWSGGGSSTLNLLFNHSDVFQTGIAIAAVGNQLNYDNIYQERYMGLPQENKQDFVNGSPITHAHKLKGNLLYIHGTGDDNVHYSNAEALINELVKHNKQFQIMPYPNRSHGLGEGEGTWEHLSTLYTNFLKQHCPPGAK
jgi:dipeptidyl-peptidase 4